MVDGVTNTLYTGGAKIEIIQVSETKDLLKSEEYIRCFKLAGDLLRWDVIR